MTCTASQAPLAPNFPDGRWLSANAVLQIADGVLDLGVAAMVGLEHEGLAVAVGDEGMEVVERQERELAARRRLDPADDEPDRDRVLLRGERGVRRLSHVGPAIDPVRDRRPGRRRGWPR